MLNVVQNLAPKTPVVFSPPIAMRMLMKYDVMWRSSSTFFRLILSLTLKNDPAVGCDGYKIDRLNKRRFLPYRMELPSL